MVTGWQPDREKLAAYRSLVGSGAELPIAFPQLPIMALHIDLLSQWSFPVRALGLVHQGAVIDVLDELPVGGPWDVRAVVSPGRHVRAGLEFDVSGEVSVDGTLCWRSTSIYLSRSRSASGAEESAVPHLDSAGGVGGGGADPGAGGDRAGVRSGDRRHQPHPPARRARARPSASRRRSRTGGGPPGARRRSSVSTRCVPGRRLEIAFKPPDRAAVHADPLLALRVDRRRSSSPCSPCRRLEGGEEPGAGAGVGGRRPAEPPRRAVRCRRQDPARPGRAESPVCALLRDPPRERRGADGPARPVPEAVQRRAVAARLGTADSGRDGGDPDVSGPGVPATRAHRRLDPGGGAARALGDRRPRLPLLRRAG